jgi:hypothetical protein
MELHGAQQVRRQVWKGTVQKRAPVMLTEGFQLSSVPGGPGQRWHCGAQVVPPEVPREVHRDVQVTHSSLGNSREGRAQQTNH